MATLSWGKPKLEIVAYTGTTPSPVAWSLFPTPKLDTSKLTTGKGDRFEAAIEGGELLEIMYKKNKYSFECEIYVVKGEARPIVDNDGETTGFYSIRLTPEDETLQGWILDKTKVSVETSWTSKDGTLLKYTFEALEPNTGNVLKPYTETYELVRGLTLNSGDVYQLHIDTNKQGYIKLPDGTIVPTVSGRIGNVITPFTYTGVNGAVVLAVEKTSSLFDISNESAGCGYRGYMFTNFTGIVNGEMCVNILGVEANKASQVLFQNNLGLTYIRGAMATKVDCGTSSVTEILCTNATEVVADMSLISNMSAPKCIHLNLHGNALTGVCIKRLLREAIATGYNAADPDGGYFDVSTGTSAGYSTWDAEMKANAATLVTRNWDVTYNA